MNPVRDFVLLSDEYNISNGVNLFDYVLRLSLSTILSKRPIRLRSRVVPSKVEGRSASKDRSGFMP